MSAESKPSERHICFQIGYGWTMWLLIRPVAELKGFQCESCRAKFNYFVRKGENFVVCDCKAMAPVEDALPAPHKKPKYGPYILKPRK